MSQYLWKYYLRDDIDGFRQLLATATYSGAHGRIAASSTSAGAIAGSPGRALATSPTLKNKSKGSGRQPGGNTITRADLNSRDSHGLTLLHHMASSDAEGASDFALTLLQAPMLDLYVQDQENGWTSLHRALYFGNVTVARALMVRDIEDAVTTHAGTHAGGLIKIKDKEGNSPFDVYGMTIASRILPHGLDQSTLSARSARHSEDESSDEATGEDDFGRPNQATFDPAIAIDGDELYLFGSNKNLNLGFGDEDDRQFPERPVIKRPSHLVQKLYREYLAALTEHTLLQLQRSSNQPAQDDMPAFVQFKPLRIFDVRLAKFHSTVLTTDSDSNLYTCGYGSGGRLGVGDTQTRFIFTPVTAGGLMHKKVTAVAVGQDHTLIVTEEGEVYSWGSNVCGQLGFGLARETTKEEDQLQLIPRQIFGSLKRETAIGCAASRTHSVVHTGASLYTFGKNDGQLGLVDADARSLKIQDVPRKVAASLFSSSIVMVSAIDKATICLLGNHEVWVFANYGYSKLQFELDSFSFGLARNSFFGARRSGLSHYVVKICSGGNTICALSSEGAVFTVALKSEPAPQASSTTNPSKIRGALSKPQELWSLRKSHMAAVDVDVGQDGSVIICTAAGSVWRREKRVKIKDTSSTNGHAKDYKFSRIPGLTRAVAVRSNAFGAFAAVRRDCDVLREQIPVDPSNLWKDIFSLLSLRGLASAEDSDTEEPAPRFWKPKRDGYDPALFRRTIITSKNIESDVQIAIAKLSDTELSTCDIKLGTTISDLRIPCHAFLLGARSEPLRVGLRKFSQEYFYGIPDILYIEYDRDGEALLIFQGIDVLTLLNVIFYIYTDGVIDVWHFTRQAPKMAYAYRQVRTEVMKLAGQLELKNLERAARLMSEPSKEMNKDLDRVITNDEFFESGGVEIELDGEQRRLHGAFICQRCPFFEAMFHGRAGGGWLSSRRERLDEFSEPISIDMKHISPSVFDLVLRYLYADAGSEIFEGARTQDLDAFLDLVLDVMAVANELMLDRLAQVCQDTLGQFVTARNVCQLLNAVAPCSVTAFKDAALEYICLNLEGMLENRLLDELDEDLMEDLDSTIQENQLNTLPIAKSGRIQEDLFEQHPELLDLLEKSRQRKIDSMALQSRLHEDEARADKINKFAAKSPVLGAKSPKLQARKSSSELVFDMEDDSGRLASDNGDLTSQDMEATGSQDGNTMALRPHTPLSHGTRTPSYSHVGGSYEASRSTPPGSLAELDISRAAASPSIPHSPEDLARQAANITSITPSPWGNASFTSDKPDMRQIMAQASESRQSNISRALSSANSPTASPTANAKMSQKERKRQQQQMRQATSAPPITSMIPAATTSPNISQPKQSPWQVAKAGPKVSLTEMLNTSLSTAGSPTASKSRPAPSLTLRQTVPGNVASQRKASADSASIPAPQTPQPKRSVSQPTAVASSSVTPSRPPLTPTQFSPSAALTPHSTRHTSPTPAEPTIQLSMADILAQQQTEKDILKEAVTKRSLLDIQEEQAFQEWWDQEEKATRERMEAEEAAKGRKEGSRGRGGRRRGKARQGAASGDGPSSFTHRGKVKGGSETTSEGANTKFDQAEASSQGRGAGSGSTSRGGGSARGGTSRRAGGGARGAASAS